MSDLGFPFRSGASSGGRESLGVQDLMARAQRLVDSPRLADGYPLEWHVEAAYVGDLDAIAVAALRSSSASGCSET